MLRRAGFRRVLPVVQIVVYVGLIWPEWVYLYQTSGSKLTLPVQLVLWQEGEGMEFHPIHIDRPTPVRVKLALLLNLPAVFPVTAAVVPFLESRPKGELFLLSIPFPFVFCLWYAVGLWIDRRLGFLPARPCTFSRLRLALWWALWSISIVILGLGAGGLVIGGLYNLPALSEVRPDEIGPTLALLVPLAWWTVFFYLVSRSGLRRVRAAAPQKT